MNKKLLSIVTITLTLSFLLGGCAKKEDNTDTMNKIFERGKIIIGVKYDTKPFGYIDENNQLAGFDIDLAKKITKELLGNERNVEFRQVTPSNRILALNSDQVDMVIATMSITKQRKEIIDFSTPYYVAGQAILVKKDSKINSISDLKNKKVIIIFGTTSENNLRMIAPDATILGFKTYSSGYKALKENKADAMISDDTILMGYAIKDKSVKLLPKRYTKEPYAIGFKKSCSSVRLETRVNSMLEDMRDTGELKQLKAKWIKW